MLHQISNRSQSVISTIFYNSHGNPVISNDPVYASHAITKSEGRVTNNKYFISYNNTGPEAGQPVNPISQHSNPHRHFDSKAGRPMQELREVNRNQFNLYIKFLQTRNTAILHELERI